MTPSNVSQVPKNMKCYLPEISPHFQTEFLKKTHLVVSPLNIVCVLISTVLNFLVLLAVYKKRRLRRGSGVLLCSINLKDLLLVSILQPMAVYRSFLFVVNGNFCAKSPIDGLRSYLIFLYRSVALTTMALISVDRWLAIHRPSLYKTVFTMKRILASIALVWLISMTISFVATYVIQPKHRYQLVFFQFGATCVMVAILQLDVYRGIKQHGKRVADLSTSQKRQMALEHSVATVVFYVILALFICYFPLLVVSAIRFSNNKNYFLITSPWMEMILYANAVANPIIWLKTNIHLRKAIVDAIMHWIAPSYYDNESMDASGLQGSRVGESVVRTNVQNGGQRSQGDCQTNVQEEKIEIK